MKLGGWKINPVLNSMPQKVATAVGVLTEGGLVGASYEPIAYLGSQQANGINHAVLAKQTLVTAKAEEKIVILKFNENGMDCSMYGVEPILEGGAAYGGFKIDVQTGDDIDPNAIKTFDDLARRMVGSSIHPVALLASKVVKGIDLVFLCTVTGTYLNAQTELQLITVNGLTNTVDFKDVL